MKNAAVTLALKLPVLAPMTLPPVIFPPEAAPTVKVPLTFAVPATFIPVPVTVIVVLPAAAIVTLPFAVAILTLLLPFASDPNKLAAVKLPETFTVPVTLNLSVGAVLPIPTLPLISTLTLSVALV